MRSAKNPADTLECEMRGASCGVWDMGCRTFPPGRYFSNFTEIVNGLECPDSKARSPFCNSAVEPGEMHF